MKNLQAPWFEKAEFYSDLDFRRLGNSSFQWGPSDKVNRKKKKNQEEQKIKLFITELQTVISDLKHYKSYDRKVRTNI